MRVSKITFVPIHTAVPIFYIYLYVSLCKLQEVMYTSTTQVHYYKFLKFDFCVN